MIRTDDCAFVTVSVDQSVAAVLTNVIHGLERLILSPHDEDILIKYRKTEIIAHISHLTPVACQLPSLEINVFFDAFVYSGIGEVFCV